MGKFTRFLYFSFLALIAFNSYAQREAKEAAEYFDKKEYKKAYELYDKLYTQSPKNLDYKFRLGYTALFYPEKKSRSIEIFEDIKKSDNSPEVNYYLAKAYHINYRFDDAIAVYKEYISEKEKTEKLTDEDKLFLEDARVGLKNCFSGKELIGKKVFADIQNMGAPLNTSEHEYVPVISTDESVLIYTYVGKNTTGGKLNDDLKQDDVEGYYHEDVYISRKVNDSTFSAGESISGSINTKGHDAAIALSPDGTILFTYTSTDEDNGDIYMSRLVGAEWTKPEKLGPNINTNAWEGSCSITSDGRFLYFASERPGGLGGRDLWLSEKVNGEWGPAVNLGPTINTTLNEDAPFIHPDGITLFFSSEGHQSIGGYDIMYSIKKENSWIEPLSMGIPLNTTEDDRYYVINAKGDRGYFSSNRGSAGGKGGQDIYTVTPGILGEKPVIALLRGNVFANDKPTEAKIEIVKKENNEVISPNYANSLTGKYLTALTPGSGYKVRITVDGYEPIEEEIDVEKLQKFIEIKKDFYVYSNDYVAKKDQQPSVKSILDSLLGTPVSNETFKNDVVVNEPVKTKVETTPEPVKTVAEPCNPGTLPDFSPLKGKSLNDPAVYKQLLNIAGNYCADGMVFKVQIAAYRHPDNYKYSHLKEFGSPDIKDYPDGITRFTVQEFKTIKDAEAVRKKVMAKGQKDAWITAVVNGKRYTLEELIAVDFLGKSIN